MSLVKKIAAAGFMLLLLGVPVFAQDATPESTETAASTIDINIAMHDYSFTVDGLAADQPLQLQAGQDYRLHITNASEMQMEHEILFGRNPEVLSSDAHLDYTEPMLEDVEVVLSGENQGQDFDFEAPGMTELEVGSGEDLFIEFTLPESKVGNWEIGCFQFLDMSNNDDNPGPTHYDKGMKLPIVVTAGAES